MVQASCHEHLQPLIPGRGDCFRMEHGVWRRNTRYSLSALSLVAARGLPAPRCVCAYAERRCTLAWRREACRAGPHDRQLTPVDYFRHHPRLPRPFRVSAPPRRFSNSLRTQGLFPTSRGDTRRGIGLALKQDGSASGPGFSGGARCRQRSHSREDP
jgi:hypothetical protein